MAETNESTKAVTTVRRGPIDLFEQIEQEMESMRRQMGRLFGRPAPEAIRPAAQERSDLGFDGRRL